jgi:ferrochelatase
MAYGTPGAVDDVERFYTHIRHGTPPSAEQLDELTARYAAIGGTSPLAERTEAQRAALQAALDDRQPDSFLVALGQNHSAPFIEDAVAALDGKVGGLVGLVLAPHFSKASVGQYRQRLMAAGPDLDVAMIRNWHDLPEWHTFLGAAVVDAKAALPERTHVLFTAHSLPIAALVDDPYEEQLRVSADAIAACAGLADPEWSLAWQSAARTPDPWKGPDVVAVIHDLAGAGEIESVLVCPQGFTSDHLEVLYDLDVVARAAADEHSLAFARTRSLNDDPAVFSALAERVVLAAART